MKKPRVITLSNGLRIVLAPQPDAPTATVLVMVKAGSEFEGADEAGVSHFLEHLAFEGSGKYPEPGQVSHELESLGAENNAWTAESHTAYWAKAQAGKAQRILEIVAELHLDPLFNEKVIDKERAVIIEEIAMYEDRPQQKAFDLWQELLYGDQPAGRSIAGTKASVRKITREQVIAYRARRYRGPETVVVIAGGFDAAVALRFLKQRFAAIDARPAAKKTRTREEQSRPSVRVMTRKSDQTQLVMGFRAFPQGHKDEYVLNTIATILGGGMSSRLFKRIRQELGAAYSVHAGAELSLDHGTLGVSIGASVGRECEVIEAVMKEFAVMKQELVSPREMNRARDFQIGGLLMSLESSDAIATYHASDLLLKGRIVPVAEVVREIRAVTAEDVYRVARRIFLEKGLNVVGLGPNLSEARIRKLLKLE